MQRGFTAFGAIANRPKHPPQQGWGISTRDSGYDEIMATTVNVSGIPHAYELTSPASSAPVVVFIHGWLLSRAYWRPVIQQLQSQYCCLSYDLRGFGESTGTRSHSPADNAGDRSQSHSLPQANFVATGTGGISSLTTAPPPLASALPFGYTPADYANDLTQLITTLGLTDVWLVGHSLGGSIALWAADLMPHAVRGAICVNAGGGIYLKEEFERFRMAGQQLVKLRPWWLCHLPFMDVMMACMNVARPVPRAWGRQRVLDWTRAEPEAARRALLDSTTADQVHRLPQVVSRLQQPVYFLAGDRDTVMEPQYVRHLASFHHSFACRGENVAEIANCGHMAMLEQPEAVARQIVQWVGQHTMPTHTA